MENRSTILEEKNELLHWQSRVEKIMEYVLTNLAADLGIGTVSEKFELSASTLRHIFKKCTGHSYHHYIEEMRMKKAFELITKEGLRIQQAMYATGYNYRSSFNKAFKKRFKHSPGYFQ